MATITIIPESIKLLRISDEEYFGKDYQQYISNSKLSLINPAEGGSEEKYQAGFQSKFSDSFELGSAVHAMLLQPGEYELASITKPTGKLGVFADKVLELSRKENEIDEEFFRRASIEADYYANKLTEARLVKAIEDCEPYWNARRELDDTLLKYPQIYLSKPNLEKTNKCLDSLTTNKKIMDTLYPVTLLGDCEVYNEYTLIADVDVEINGKVTRVKLKGKLDNFTVNHETRELTLNDVKTTGKPVSFFMGNWVNVGEVKKWFPGSFQTYHYYRQMGMYLWLLACLYKHQGINYDLKANMILVETFPEHESKICKVYDKHIKQGLDEFKDLLIKVVKWTEQEQTT